jgi:HD-GYP domain-containing protein (c-di-GMP phosphodiesterase class II)
VPLTESDWEQIHEHPAAGARALEGIAGYEPV